MTLDRTKQPEIHDIDMPKLPVFEDVSLNNGVNVHILKLGTQPIVRIDMVFKAGIFMADKVGVARIANNLLAEGTADFNHEQIAERIDFCGATIWQRMHEKYSITSLIIEDKHFLEIIPYFEQIIKCPTFPDEQLKIFIDKDIQKMKISMQKTSYNAAKAFKQNMFKQNTRYSRVMELEDFTNITRSDLLSFHEKRYAPNDLDIFISGQPSENTLQCVYRAFGENWDNKAENVDIPAPEFIVGKNRRVEISVEGAKQASINMGCPFVAIDHEDTLPMYIVNTILGGYFGSRLMSNIREEKGLTYGIGSVCSSRSEYGLIQIFSDVKPDMSDVVIEEIMKEMKLLHTELVSTDELDMVVNYIKGTTLTHYDSILATMDTIIPFFLEGVCLHHDKLLYDTMKNITPLKIMELAQKYLLPENFLTITAK